METTATVLYADVDAFYASIVRLLDPSERRRHAGTAGARAVSSTESCCCRRDPQRLVEIAAAIEDVGQRASGESKDIAAEGARYVHAASNDAT